MAEPAEILAQPVSFGGTNVSFGELTAEQARERADELRALVGFGPTVRVAPVARAWRELAMALDCAGAARVSELPSETLLALAPKLWVVPPGGSLL
ncbi:MAG TPA: hypothetical protein VLP43_12090 [Solirubrobacteraceae bacterium]|nr:hypothetical protein [Solirubrobacteraceae bacterium]